MDCTPELRKATADLAFIASTGQPWLDELSAEFANQTSGVPNSATPLGGATWLQREQIHELARLLRYWLQLSDAQAMALACDHYLDTRLKRRCKALATVAEEIRQQDRQQPKPKAAAVAASVNRRLSTTRNGGTVTVASNAATDPLIAQRGTRWK